MGRLLVASLLVLLAGCTSTREVAQTCCTSALPAGNSTGVVFVANGSGDIRNISDHLCVVFRKTGTPLQVQPFVWSVGHNRYVLDHLSHGNQIEQGRRLACEVLAYRQACPGKRIYLVGYSTGTSVVLAAAEQLPPESVERIVLLASSVCTRYDLRPALRSTRVGIDSFYSKRDRYVLGVGMALLGTADRGCRTPAGRVGFTPVLACPEDAALYSKLHEHAWEPTVLWTGNEGGHYGSDRLDFLQAYVLPLLTAP